MSLLLLANENIPLASIIFKERMPVPPAVIHLRFEPATPTESAEILSKFLMTDATRLMGRYWVITRQTISL